jgi:hypothetical protein
MKDRINKAWEAIHLTSQGLNEIPSYKPLHPKLPRSLDFFPLNRFLQRL